MLLSMYSRFLMDKALFTIGLFFSLAIMYAVKGKSIRRIAFLFGSYIIYIITVIISFIDAYWGPDPNYLALAIFFGTFAETAFFGICFGHMKSIDFKYFLLICGIALMSFLIIIGGDSFILGIIFWYVGMGVTFYLLARISQNELDSVPTKNQ